MTWAVSVLLPEWRQALGDRGRRAFAPGDAAELHYAEGVPAAPMDTLVAEELTHWPGLDVAATGPVELLVTDEGEYAALVTLAGTRDGAPVVVTIGAVLGDESAAVLVSLAQPPGLVETTRELLCKDVQGRGPRRRMVRHTPPPGWQARRLGLECHYCDGTAQISVWPAVPRPPELPLAPAALAAQVDPSCRPRAIARGVEWEREHAGQSRRVALLVDEGYLYAARLDAAPGDQRAEEAFAALVASLEPLPAPRGRRAGPSVVELWAV